MEQDKINAYMTLYTVITDLIKVSAPFVPFITEMIYQNIVRSVDRNAPESVHLCDFPEYDAQFADAGLEQGMDIALQMVVLGRACRNTANIKNRQPLSKLYAVTERTVGGEFLDIVADELNVKGVEIVKGSAEFTTYRFKPQLKTLGPRYGKLLPKISAYLADVDGDAAMAALKAGNNLEFVIDGTDVSLSKDDLLIETARKEGYVSDSNGDVTVVLDVNLTPELVEEGFVREIVSKVQTMRKEAGYEVQDHIVFGCAGNAVIEGIVNKNLGLISKETLSDGLLESVDAEGSYKKEWSINAEQVVLAVKRT
jgi:isoleucyl-tRNA synthetase